MNGTGTTVTAQKPKRVFPRVPKPIWWIREVLAILLWLAAMVQLLAYDIMGVLPATTPLPKWLVTYRGLVFLGLVTIAWLLLGNARFFRYIGYILLYPCVVVFWHIPRTCLRRWPILLAFSPAILPFLRSFRFYLALYGLSLISAVIIFVATATWQVIPAMVLLGSLLLIHHYRQMRTVFAAKTVFAAAAEAVSGIWEKVKTSDMFVPPADVDPTTQEGRTKFGSSLITAYLLTAGLGRIAKGMRSVAESRKLDFFLVVSWCITVCLTVFVFAFLFLGLEKCAPGSFVDSTGFLGFLGYSLCVLTTSDLSHVQPVSNAARVLSYLELGGSIYALILMVFLILTSVRDRYRDDLSRVVDELGTTARQFEDLLASNYKLTIRAAEEWLLSYSRQLARYALRLRHEKDAIAALEAEMQRKAAEEDPEKSLGSGLGGDETE